MDFAAPFSVLDGGLSTALEQAGHALDDPLWTARLVIEQPAAIVDAHLAYLRAGAEVLITASYQASVSGYLAAGLRRPEALAAIGLTTELAREAVARFRRERELDGDVLVAASVGPYGATLADGSEYRGDYRIGPGLLRDFHVERLETLVASEPDLLACETIPSVAELEALAAALGQVPHPPVWVAMSCRDEAHTSAGEPIESAIRVAAGIDGIAAVGVNCTAPHLIGPLLERISAVTSLPLVAYANSGREWDAGAHCWIGPAEPVAGAGDLARWVAAGARLIGGCCGVGPAEIAELRTLRDRFDPPDLAA